MRKLRDYDAELKALEDRAKHLRTRKVTQHGELVAATGADTLDGDLLAGGLLALTELNDTRRKEQLRERGAAFFRTRSRKTAASDAGDVGSATARDGAGTSTEREAGAA